MQEHDGHRERMRKRFVRYGLDSFNDHNVLELLLFYAQPRKDTNLMAHRLLDAFGSLDGVFDATPEALMAVEGVGEHAAALIHLVPAAAARYFQSKLQPGQILLDSQDAGRYLLPRFLTCRDETVFLVCMDAKLKVLDCRQLGQGSATTVAVSVRRIAQIALEQNASAVLLAHNHTSGLAVPSDEDVSVTLHIMRSLAPLGIRLTDHIIVAGDDFVSLADSGLLPKE